MYIPVDALARHEDFDTWYEDGDLFLHFACKKGWKSEKDRVQIFGRMGGQVGEIKPDNRALVYDIMYERFIACTPTSSSITTTSRAWCGTCTAAITSLPTALSRRRLSATTANRCACAASKVQDHGPCYEVHVLELEKLRIAVACLVAIGYKEEWKGLSEGEDRELGNLWQRMKGRIFENKGFTYEQIQQMIAEDHPLVKILKPTGRPIDNPKSHYKKRRDKEQKQKEEQEKNLAAAKKTLHAIRSKNAKDD